MPFIEACKQCGKSFKVKPYLHGKIVTCSIACTRELKRGTRLDSTGNGTYRQVVRSDGKFVLTHRYVMEKHLGRKLGRFELVHHKNGDKSDNHLENLEVVTPKEHAAHHQLKHPLTRVCVHCGETFTPPLKHRGRNITCSQKCRYANLSAMFKGRVFRSSVS